jgi:hypothetical protein
MAGSIGDVQSVPDGYVFTVHDNARDGSDGRCLTFRKQIAAASGP